MAKKIDINGLGHYHDKVSAMVADEYSSSATYAVGDYCFHTGTLYKCTTAITTAEAWTSGHWTAAKLAEDTSELKSALTVLEPTATSADVGKALIAKTVADGVVTEYEFGEAGGGASAIINSVENVAIASFDDGTASAVKQLVVSVDPVQDLHGQANPYPAGGGINIFNAEDLEVIVIPTSGGGITEKYGKKYTVPQTYSVHAYGTSDISAYLYARVKNSDDSWESAINVVAGTNVTSDTVVTITEGQELYIYNASAGETEEASTEKFLAWKYQVAVANTKPAAYHPYSNICPITGWTRANVTRTGKNLFDPDNLEHFNINTNDMFYGHIFTKAGNYAIKAYSAFTENAYIYARIKNADGTFENTQYIVANQSRTPQQISLPENKSLYVFDAMPQHTAEEASALFNGWKLQVAYQPTQPEEFSEYTGETYEITFPAAAGTVYGGTLTNLGTDEWKLTVDKGAYSIKGTETFSLTSSGSLVLGSNNNLAVMSNFNVAYPVKPIVSHYNGTSYVTTLPNGKAEVYNGTSGRTFSFKDDRFSSIEDYTSYLAAQYANGTPVSFVLPLATPVEYTFTTSEVIELLSGYNNVWADTGDIKLLEYYADSKTYIDGENALVKALIAKELPSMVADTALTANDFRIVNNTLYKVTTSIASGATLTVGTNVVATTLAEVIKPLLS